MAAINSSALSTQSQDFSPKSGFSYSPLVWGEVICGTKGQLQSIGIACGELFPGEPGGPKRLLNSKDSRGFAVKIEFDGRRDAVGRIYRARIKYPGRERNLNPEPQAFAPGVTVTRHLCSDEYRGTAEALVAAGLVRDGQFPGMPGMRKHTVTVLPDGKVASSGNCPGAKEPGARSVAKSGQRFTVAVTVDGDEKERRRAAWHANEREWEARMLAMPRPEPLIDRALFDEVYVSRLEMARQEAAKRVEGWSAAMPQSRGDFVERQARMLQSSLGIQLDHDMGYGYDFDAETKEKLRNSILAIGELMRAGRVDFSPAQRIEFRRDHVREAFERDILPVMKEYGQGESAKRREFEQFAQRLIPVPDSKCGNVVLLSEHRMLTKC